MTHNGLLWLPGMSCGGGANVLCHDEFTDAGLTNLTAHTIAPVQGGLSWSPLKSGDNPTYRINGNAVEKSVAGTYALTYAPIVVSSGEANCIVECDLKYTTQTTSGIIVRGGAQTSPTFHLFFLYNSSGYLNKLNYVYWNGSSMVSPAASATGSFTNGVMYPAKVTLNGSSMLFECNGLSLSVTDTVAQTQTKHGIAAYNTYSSTAGVQWDNFKISELV